MFQIIGTMAEFERALIEERVKAGLRNARAKGKKPGRPRADVDLSQVEALRASGVSWREIAEKLGVGLGTVHRSLHPRSKNASLTFRTVRASATRIRAEHAMGFSPLVIMRASSRLQQRLPLDQQAFGARPQMLNRCMQELR